jgi:hypothetical protein
VCPERVSAPLLLPAQTQVDGPETLPATVGGLTVTST